MKSHSLCAFSAFSGAPVKAASSRSALAILLKGWLIPRYLLRRRRRGGCVIGTLVVVFHEIFSEKVIELSRVPLALHIEACLDVNADCLMIRGWLV